MIIDCDRCEMRDVACDDCVVSVLLATPAPRALNAVEIEDDTARALDHLAAGGLVPPLRLRLRAAGAG